ncbi:MAG: hypothetical protein KC486_19680 [Myxococcales bacterium]|nr:hypothetical protein [Myxococcales bacterium]
MAGAGERARSARAARGEAASSRLAAGLLCLLPLVLAALLGPAAAGAALPQEEGTAEGPSPAPRAVVGEPADALEDEDPDADDERPPAAPTADGKPRRFMIGLEGVALLTPALRPQLIRVDRRYVGETTTLGGAGVFGRWRAVDRIALDLGVRAGSLRFQDAEKGDLVAQDLILAELGALLFLARGEIGHLAIDAGFGGLAHQIRYSTAGGLEGTQRVGAALFRTGLDIELLLKRLAFVISLRAYGVITDRDRTSSKGTIFEGVDPALRSAPVPVYQTYVIGSAGVAYRF